MGFRCESAGNGKEWHLTCPHISSSAAVHDTHIMFPDPFLIGALDWCKWELLNKLLPEHVSDVMKQSLQAWALEVHSSCYYYIATMRVQCNGLKVKQVQLSISDSQIWLSKGELTDKVGMGSTLT